MKIYVGRTTERENKFGELETQIGFTAEEIQKLTDNLNDKGWVNVTIRKSKEGKPYAEIYVPDTKTSKEELPF